MSNKIASIDDLAKTRAYGFEYLSNGVNTSGFLVEKDGEIFAYKNHCPHTGAPLDWVEHQFLDRDQYFIQCAVHDARFEVNTGLCVQGPCINQNLLTIKIEIKNQDIWLVD